MPGVPVRLYECTVLGVSAKDRVMTARSRNGADFRNISYMLPYMNLLGGGIDFVPKSGDKCLVLSTPMEAGPLKSRLAVCIGFEMPVNPQSGGLQLGGRDTDLTPGSVGIHAKGEDGSDAYVLCLAGGTLVMGSGNACSTLYSPIDNSVMHVFDNWHMLGSGGHVRWTRDGSSVSYQSEYRTEVDEESQATKVNVRIGGDGDDPLEIVVGQGALDPPPLRIAVGADGEVTIEGQVINIRGDKSVDIDGGQVTIKGKQVLGEKDPI